MVVNRNRRKFLVTIKCNTCGGEFGCSKTNIKEICAKMVDMIQVTIRHYKDNNKENFWLCRDCYEDIMIWNDNE